MKCPKCNKENLAGAVYCSYCATQISRTCSCGTVNIPLQAKFCPTCGKTLLNTTHNENLLPKTDSSTDKKSSNSQSSIKGWVIGFVAVVLFVLIGVCVWDNNNSSSTTPRTENVNTYPSSSSNQYQETINYTRVNNLIGDICRYASKGSYYYMLENYFAETIWPHPSGQMRYRSNIANKTKSFVESYSEYQISAPRNFQYLNTSFPLTVKCDVDVTWVNKKNVRKRAVIRKTYYINSNYKVTGYEDKELSRKNI